MKLLYPLYFVYQWLIAMPLMLISTVITSILIFLISPVFPNHKISYLPGILWGKFVCYLFFIHVKISGMEHLDRKQSYVFAANHQSAFDILVIYGWLPYIFKWLLKIELRKVPFLGAACQAAGHIFVDRSNPVAAKQSMQKALEQLKNFSRRNANQNRKTRQIQTGCFSHGTGAATSHRTHYYCR